MKEFSTCQLSACSCCDCTVITFSPSFLKSFSPQIQTRHLFCRSHWQGGGTSCTSSCAGRGCCDSSCNAGRTHTGRVSAAWWWGDKLFILNISDNNLQISQCNQQNMSIFRATIHIFALFKQFSNSWLEKLWQTIWNHQPASGRLPVRVGATVNRRWAYLLYSWG